MDLKSKIILISGPTASGKSSFAIKVAKKVDGEIINADSMQVYKQLKILSADNILSCLYTCILSALMISPSTFFATLIAKLDLPEAVGPDINIILDFKSIISLA